MEFELLDLQFYMYVLQIVVCPFVLFFWPLRCLFFLDIWILITPLVSSNSSLYKSYRYSNLNAKDQPKLPNRVITNNHIKLPNRVITNNHIKLHNRVITNNHIKLPNRVITNNHIKLPNRVITNNHIKLPNRVITSNHIKLPNRVTIIYLMFISLWRLKLVSLLF